MSTGYTWSKAMALNYAGEWGTWGSGREYERHAFKSPMPHDRPQTFYPLSIPDKPLSQDLQRHLATQPGIGGPIDRTHPSFAQLRRDFVVVDGLALQQASRLRGPTQRMLDF